MVIVRPAKDSDIPWILDQLQKFADFYGTKRLLISKNHEQNVRIIKSMIKTDVFLVAENGKGRVGFVSGFLVPHAFNPELRLLSETFWWVCEGHRGSRAARLLLDAFVEEGKKKADIIDFALVVGKTNCSDRHLSSRGFVLKEKRFLLEV